MRGLFPLLPLLFRCPAQRILSPTSSGIRRNLATGSTRLSLTGSLPSSAARLLNFQLGFTNVAQSTTYNSGRSTSGSTQNFTTLTLMVQ